MNFKKTMLKIGSYLLFALSLLFLFIPSFLAYLLGYELVTDYDESFFSYLAMAYNLLFIGLSYLCHRFSKIREISFSALFFLFPCQIFILSGIINFFEPHDKRAVFLALFIIPIWVLISLKIYQHYKKRNSA